MALLRRRFVPFLPSMVPNLPREIPTAAPGHPDPRFTVRSNSVQTLPPSFHSPIKKLSHEEKYVPSGPVSGVCTPIRKAERPSSFALAIAISRVGRRGR